MVRGEMEGKWGRGKGNGGWRGVWIYLGFWLAQELGVLWVTLVFGRIGEEFG